MSEDKARDKNDDGTHRGSENPLWQEQVAESGRPPVNDADTTAHTTVLNTAGESDRTTAGAGGTGSTETRPLDRSAAPAAGSGTSGTSGSNDTTVLGAAGSSAGNDTTV